MKTETATHAKMHFGKVLENALKEPVVIEKSGRNVAVLISYDEYKRLAELEDKYWLTEAVKAKKEGFIGTDASDALLSEILNAKD